MEVHAHSHTARKKWTHYLWEFLMLFLAVFCGFLAENYREHLGNTKKEKHFAESLSDDLKKDTIRINDILTQQKILLDKMDSVLKIPKEQLKEVPVQRLFYKNFIYFYSWVPIFIRSEGTITQLKSAGGLNIFRNQLLIDSISKLDNYYDGVKYNNDWYVKECDYVDNTASRFIIVWKLPSEFSDTTFSAVPEGIEIFNTYDSQLLVQLYNYIKLEKSMIGLLIFMENVYKTKAGNLLNDLKKEYHLK